MLKNIVVGGPLSSIAIGRRGENLATTVVFDCTQLAEQYGAGNAVLLVRRPNDADAYPAITTQEGDSVTWVVSETDTARQGHGQCELFWYVGEVLAKSIVYMLSIAADIGASSPTPPDPYEEWVEEIARIGAEVHEDAGTASQAAEDAQAALAEFTDITVSAEQLPSGSPPSATYEDGHLTLGIPLADAEIRQASIAFSVAWSGSGPWTQVVTVTGALITTSSLVALQPTAAQLSALMAAGVTAIVVDNADGILTATALGAAPTEAMTVQCTVTEVE